MGKSPTPDFERHARTLTVLTVLSRLCGLARDATLSRVFGVGPIMSAFWLGFMVPNLFRRLFGEGALSAAFLPVFTRESDHDPGTARRLAWLVISVAIVVLSAVVLIVEIVLGAGVLSGRLESNGVRLMAIMLPYAPMVCMVALVGAMLQAHGRFGPTAAAPIILNVILVATALVLVPAVDSGVLTIEGQISIVAASVLVAGIVQVAWSLIALRRVLPPAAKHDPKRARSLARGVGLQALPMIIGLGVLQLNTLLDGLIASWPTIFGPEIPILDIAYPLHDAAMAELSWAQRLYEFPLGVFGIAIATAIFPQLSREHGGKGDFVGTLRRGIRITFFVGLPATVGLILVRTPLTAVVYQGSAFTAEDTRAVAFILLGYAPAIWAYCLLQVLVRAFYARGEAMLAVKVAIGVVVLNLLLNVTLIWTPLRVAGLAWSTAFCAVVQAVILYMMLSNRMGRIVNGDALRGILATLVVAIATALSGGVALLLIEPSRFASSWWAQLASLAVIVCAGALGAFACAYFMRMKELGWVLGIKSGDRGG